MLWSVHSESVCYRVLHITEGGASQDITPYILRNQPEDQFATGAGAGGNIFTGTYRLWNSTTQRTEDVKVNHNTDHFRACHLSECAGRHKNVEGHTRTICKG